MDKDIYKYKDIMYYHYNIRGYTNTMIILLVLLTQTTGPVSAFAAVAKASDSFQHGMSSSSSIETKYCEFYNATACNGTESNCYDKEECGAPDSDKRNHCYVLWRYDNNTNTNQIKLKGCFTDSKECYDRLQCIDESHKPKKDLMYCCCEGNMCNQNFTWVPSVTEAPIVKVGAKPVEDDTVYITILCVTVPLLLIGFVLGVVYFFCRHRKMGLFNELPTIEPSLSCPPSPEGLEDGFHLPIELKEVKARGRFGAVWRATLNQQEVAVKIFPVQDKQSWVAEQEIFKLPRMNHADILQFIGIEKRGDNLQAEYWLITGYHDKGSLCDYLKAHTVTWAEAWSIAHTMARGLTHLHDEIAASRSGGRKPAIAHRDFKSKNVLLKKDMSACIADFGLALIFQPGKPCGDTHGQVGTRRYMAPEVLEGAINFTRDSFLRIDMYACGLVLWEIASRCTSWGDVGEYMLPFEEEVGAHPSLEEMQDAVVLRKLRPNIPESWRDHNALNILCDTMEECWDHDAEARLSASCVMERIGAMSKMPRRSQTRTPLLIENARPLPPYTPREE